MIDPINWDEAYRRIDDAIRAECESHNYRAIEQRMIAVMVDRAVKHGQQLVHMAQAVLKACGKEGYKAWVLALEPKKTSEK